MDKFQRFVEVLSVDIDVVVKIYDIVKDSGINF